MRADSVAVIIASYNGEATIARAVRSALAQPEAAEIIVVIDGSTDGAAGAARAADDGSGRLNVIALPANRGPAGARNVGLKATQSPWITILDDDDYMEPGRLSRLLALSEGFDFIADDLWLIEEGAPPEARAPMWFDGAAKPQTLSLATFAAANCPHPARMRRELGFLKPLMRRDFLARGGLRYDEAMRLGEDYDLYARALAAGARFLLVPAQGYVATRRAGSLSAKHGAADLRALRHADDRLLQTAGLSETDRAALRDHRLSTDKRYQWQRLIDAVKARDVGEALACFGSDWRTSAHLAGQLWNEAVRRLL